ncbi:hypothetical protein PO124_00770 [Bacillus licheniformis]|nr:hypothetical protein [Bacillus licheniformis]
MKQAPEFLAALQTKAGAEGLIDELKRQFSRKIRANRSFVHVKHRAESLKA